jgi:hypothetical protein
MQYKDKQKPRKRKSLHSLSYASHPFPSTLFNTEQVLFALKIIEKYKEYYRDYYRFRFDLLNHSGFIFILFERRLFNEILKPVNVLFWDWKLMMLVYALYHSDIYKDCKITTKFIIDRFHECNTGYKCNVEGRLMKLRKLGFLAARRLPPYSKAIYVSEKGTVLIRAYGKRYSQLFNDFFQPEV